MILKRITLFLILKRQGVIGVAVTTKLVIQPLCLLTLVQSLFLVLAGLAVYYRANYGIGRTLITVVIPSLFLSSGLVWQVSLPGLVQRATMEIL